MQDHQDPIRALLTLLRRHAPELRPVCRFLLLGPYLAGAILTQHSRRPTVRELIALKRVVERHGPTMGGLLASLLEASGQASAIRVEIRLDRLLELDPALWAHPVQAFGGPISDAPDLLAACRLRMESAAKEEKERLAAVEEKLARAVRIEGEARETREKVDEEG